MRLLGFDMTLSRTKAIPVGLSPATSRGWWATIRESFTGAWQRNVDVSVEDVVTNPTVWACVTIIANDISKLWLKLVEEDEDGICTEIENPAYSPVLRKPNHYQTRVKFLECWMLSKLLHGNTYVLKERNNRGSVRNGNVIALYVLDPSRVQVLVAPDGSVFYQLSHDNLSGLSADALTVPASEIIHDIMVPLYHPLVGVSPIHASGMAALQGLKIQANSSKLFESGTNLSGVLSTPHPLPQPIAEVLQKNWAANFQGQDNIGKVAIVGDDFKFTPMTMSAVDAQLIDQLRWSDERICATLHVPGYKIGIGPFPPYTDIQSVNLEYYNTALQAPIENLESLLTEGLELPARMAVEVDLKALLRMDTRTQVDNATKGILGGLFKPNEARAEFDLLPVEGGDTVYLQQQQYSLQALNRRDQQPAPPTDPPPVTPTPDNDETKAFDYAALRTAVLTRVKEFSVAA